MARLGSNPSRNKTTDFRPSKVTVAVLAYVPSLDGYFKYRFEILKLTIASILNHTLIDFDLMVFDNGCCQDVSMYLSELKEKGLIDYLLSSPRNLGNWGALRMMLRSAPGDIIAYSDDDVLHYPGWLKPQIEILETFPKVGMVSGVPVRNAQWYAQSSMDTFIANPSEGVKISHERRINDEWEQDWAESTGRDSEVWKEKTKDMLDVVLEKDGVEAIAHANHFQFVGYKEVLIQGIPQSWEGELMGDMVKVDETIAQLGYIRLSTPDCFVSHIGNAISEKTVAEAEKLGLMEIEPSDLSRVDRHWLLKLPGMGRILMWLYNWIYKIVFLREDI